MSTKSAIIGLLVLVTAGTGYAETFDPISAHDALLAEAAGFFAYAGGTGGQGGNVVYVTNLNDSGPGSMRDFLTRSEPLIILFENGVNGTINVNSRIDIQSNKTIWGRHRDGSAADIFVHPTTTKAPFDVRNGNKNIIITNFKGDAPGPNDAAPDLVQIANPGGLVWVHHVTAIGDGTANMDGFVDVQADNVTLSWNRVLSWDNVHLLYPYPDGSKNVTLTMHHNLFRDSAGRMPKTAANKVSGTDDQVIAHAYNNWLDNWGYDSMRTDGGEIRIENNVFTPGGNTTDKRAIQGRWAGSGNVFLNGAFADSQSSGVFTPPYSYTLDPVGTAAEQQAFRDRLEAEAGWQSDFADTTPPAAPQNLRIIVP